MTTSSEIVPLCLYSNDKSSYLSLPQKTNTRYSCPNIQDKEYKGTFYLINEDIKPKPNYTDLICITNNNLQTTEIKLVYDPFNVDIKCNRFLVWLEKTPCTIPLYIFRKDSDIYVSTENKKPSNDYVYNEVPVIYVIPDPELDLKLFNCEGNFSKKGSDILVKFTDHYGKCIPEPKGESTLGECMVAYNKNILRKEHVNKYPHVINFLGIKYGKNKKNVWLIVLGVILIFLALFTILKLKLKSR
jgi:hypothetical protein